MGKVEFKWCLDQNKWTVVIHSYVKDGIYITS